MNTVGTTAHTTRNSPRAARDRAVQVTPVPAEAIQFVYIISVGLKDPARVVVIPEKKLKFVQ